MDAESRRENQKLRLFSAVTFGMPLLMGIAMAYSYFYHSETSLNAFPLTQMLYPAAGVMLAYLSDKAMRSELPKGFFYFYLTFTLLCVIMTLIGSLCGTSNGIMMELTIILATIITYFIFYYTDKSKLKNAGLSYSNCWKKTIGYLILFIVLSLSIHFLGSFLSGEPMTNGPINKTLILMLPLNFLWSFLIYLGEEYGWRFFLQPILQRRYGNIKGVIMLGALWGIWHLPLNIFYYNRPDAAIQSILGQLIVCVCLGIFMGYVYMKTENIWSVVIIHYLQNNLIMILSDGDSVQSLVPWGFWFLVIVPYCVYLPFLFTKTYRTNDCQTRCRRKT